MPDDDDVPPHLAVEERLPPPTMEELLPALVELASIQTDMIARLENPASRMSAFQAPYPQSPYGPTPVPLDMGLLKARSQSLLRWLLMRAQGQR